MDYSKGLLKSYIILVGFFLTLISCQPQEPMDEMPYIMFDPIIINLNFPTYSSLQFDGGYLEIDGGIRGIIIYRESTTTYHAYERNCPYLPNEACATVNVDSSGLFMIDPCCSSTFNFQNGHPLGGPTFFPLRRYRTYLQSSELTITDEILNN
ncbi:MAG: hypothetical protein OEX02_03055 [Cyclobacteriaceae bacterium]|nr:hypothetical protein [Cyclobacteriaceae bacterium]